MKLRINQLDQLFKTISRVRNTKRPKEGWIKTIRQALDMSVIQLASKLNISRQSLAEIEKREAEGTITLNTLKTVAKAMDMEFHYILIPKDGTLELLINRKAYEMAKKIVAQTSQSMKLEDQENDKLRLKYAIKERAEQIKQQELKILWI